MKQYDLIVRGGTLIDPAQKIHGKYDVGITAGVVMAVEPSLADATAPHTIDATGKYVTPGLIDLHVHIYEGVSHWGVDADSTCLAQGVTTAIDAGSSGADTFPGLRKYVLEVSQTRTRAFLNISRIGLIADRTVGELMELRYLDPQLAVQTIEKNRDRILGIKVRLSEMYAGGNDVQGLKLAREAADAVGLPIMIHFGATRMSILQILNELRPGDILTHCHHGRKEGIVDPQMLLLPEVRQAHERGVLFDVGHGQGSFTWRVAEQALAQDFPPDTISSDLHYYNLNGPVHDLATVMSKYLILGMDLDAVVDRTTAAPARVIKMEDALGTLRPGSVADLAIFELDEGKHTYVDSFGNKREGDLRLMPWAVVRGGTIVDREALRRQLAAYQPSAVQLAAR